MASGFNISNIGGMDTGGQPISHWWYTGTNPTLKGTGLPSTDVTIEIDGTPSTVTTDSSGDWTYASTMAEGDHTVKLTNAGTIITFTLTLGADKVNWEAVGKGTSSTLPATGVSWPTMFLIIGGLLTMLIGGKIFLGHSS